MVSPSRSLRGRIGAYAMHARNDSRVVTTNARAAFMAKFEDEVDPHRELPEPERQRRAGMARRAYFTRLAWRSSVARSKKAPAPLKADALEVERVSAHTTAS